MHIIILCTLTRNFIVLGIDDLDDIIHYLFHLSKEHIHCLGLILGLFSHTLNQHRDSSQYMYLSHMLEAWLRRQDKVVQKSGAPTWRSLVKALKDDQLRQNGIARKIEEDKLQHNMGTVWEEEEDEVVKQVGEGRKKGGGKEMERQKEEFEGDKKKGKDEEEEEEEEVKDVKKVAEMVRKPNWPPRKRARDHEVPIGARRLRIGFASHNATLQLLHKLHSNTWNNKT